MTVIVLIIAEEQLGKGFAHSEYSLFIYSNKAECLWNKEE